MSLPVYMYNSVQGEHREHGKATLFFNFMSYKIFIKKLRTVGVKKEKKCQMCHLTCHSNRCFCMYRVFEG